MHDTDRQQLRRLIAERLDALEEDDRRGQSGQAVVGLDQQSVGRLSRMDALQSQAMAKATQGRRDSHRHALVQALRRIDDPEFGYCDACGDEIALKRLQFDPSVTRCIGCAAPRE